MTENTDWDQYYRKPSKASRFTRALTTNKIIRLLRPFTQCGEISVCEIGGANSCILPAIAEQFGLERYHIIDNNLYGLSLLNDGANDHHVSSEHLNILSEGPREEDLFDIVLSIGLIEHFDEAGTKRAIEEHIIRCRPDGVILLTFPTPTWLYTATRWGAEKLDSWNFPDERPLRFPEVLKGLSDKADIIHTSITWGTVLTQGCVLARVRSDT